MKRVGPTPSFFPILWMLLASVMLSPALPSSAAETRTYRLAVIIPLTGPVASLGKYVKEGVELAYQALPPERRSRLELLFEDDQFDPKQTLSAYQRLSASKPLDAVFVIGSPPANALAPITERNKQILMAIGGSDPSIVKDRRYAFIHWVIPSVLGRRLADELLRLDFQRIAFIAGEASGALADKQAAIDSLTANGAAQRVIFNDSFERNVTDYRATINTLKAKHADAVVLVLFPGALSAFAKQARQLDLGAELVGMETFEDEAEVKAAEGALNNAWYVNASDPTPEFAARYRAAYGTYPGWAAANGFDSLRLIADAIAVGADSDTVREFLGKVHDYHGAAGIYSASGDNRFLLPAALKRITAAGFESLENHH